MCVHVLSSWRPLSARRAPEVNELQPESPLTRDPLIRQGLRDRLSLTVLTSASG